MFLNCGPLVSPTMSLQLHPVHLEEVSVPTSPESLRLETLVQRLEGRSGHLRRHKLICSSSQHLLKKLAMLVLLGTQRLVRGRQAHIQGPALRKLGKSCPSPRLVSEFLR